MYIDIFNNYIYADMYITPVELSAQIYYNKITTKGDPTAPPFLDEVKYQWKTKEWKSGKWCNV